MEKIPSLFKRRYDGDRQVYDEVTPGAEWVQAGEGIPTIKWDGTSCLMRDGVLFKRYSGKINGKLPADFEEAERDETTGKVFGWVPVGHGPEDQYHREGFEHTDGLTDGTYELVGPKIQGNPHRYSSHVLVRHGADILDGIPTSYEELKAELSTLDFEGIVWWHSDGRKVKIKRKDVGLPWPPR